MTVHASPLLPITDFNDHSWLICRLISATLRWPLIDKDDARDSFQHLAEQRPGIDHLNALSYEVSQHPVRRRFIMYDDGMQNIKDTPVNKGYVCLQVMFRYARTQLQLRLNVVLDCPLARKELYETALEIAQQVRCTRRSSRTGKCGHIGVSQYAVRCYSCFSLLVSSLAVCS
jgi:hypothetical protein